MNNKDKWKIQILLTRHSDYFSKFFRLVTFGNYSHASIGFEGDDRFYSFTKKGFRVEHPLMTKNKKRKQSSCALLQLTVTKEKYSEIKSYVEKMILEKESYKYSFLGLFLSLIGISIKRRHYYFCSQFVSEMLIFSGAVSLKKDSTLYLPDDFMKEQHLNLLFQGSLLQLIELYSSLIRDENRDQIIIPTAIPI